MKSSSNFNYISALDNAPDAFTGHFQPSTYEISIFYAADMNIGSNRPNTTETPITLADEGHHTAERPDTHTPIDLRHAKLPSVKQLKRRTHATNGQTHAKRPSHWTLNFRHLLMRKCETSEISASDANEVLVFDGPTTSASYVRCADERADAFDRPMKRETSVPNGNDKTDARSDWPKFCETSVRFEEQKAGTRSDHTKKREHFVRYGEELSNSPKKVMLVTEMKERTHAPIAILPSLTQMKC